MSNIHIATQLYLMRREASADLFAVLDAAKAAGFDGVEFCGLFGHTAGEIRKKLDVLGLKAVSDHVTLAMLQNDLERTLDDRRALGCEFIVLGWLAEEDRHYGPRFGEVLADLNVITERCRAAGLPLGYHNHNFEFTRPEAGNGLTRLLDGVPGIQPQFDAGWLAIAGQDPVAMLRKYAGRYVSVHLKDYLSTDARENHDFCPIGMGKLDWKAIASAAVAGGARWLIADQDDDARRTPAEAAALNAKYLRSLGYGA